MNIADFFDNFNEYTEKALEISKTYPLEPGYRGYVHAYNLMSEEAYITGVVSLGKKGQDEPCLVFSYQEIDSDYSYNNYIDEKHIYIPLRYILDEDFRNEILAKEEEKRLAAEKAEKDRGKAEAKKRRDDKKAKELLEYERLKKKYG